MVVPARPVSGAPIASDWGAVAHDSAVAFDFQSGKVTMSIAGATANQAIVFPRPFGNPTVNVVVALASAPGGTAKLIPRTTSQGTTGFTLWLYVSDGSVVTATVDVCWMAHGWRS